jgi:hypothetical protein
MTLLQILQPIEKKDYRDRSSHEICCSMSIDEVKINPDFFCCAH